MSFLDDVIEAAQSGEEGAGTDGEGGTEKKPEGRAFGYSGEFDGRYGGKKGKEAPKGAA
jgi:hypothetical protein